jgi:hypothetical protein
MAPIARAATAAVRKREEEDTEKRESTMIDPTFDAKNDKTAQTSTHGMQSLDVKRTSVPEDSSHPKRG